MGLFSRRETRADSYTNQILQIAEANAFGGSRSAVVEACAGVWAHALAAAQVSGGALTKRLVTPGFLASVGRDLITTGQSLWLLRMSPVPELLRAFPPQLPLEGGPERNSWRYQLSLEGPVGSWTAGTRSAAEIIDIRWDSLPSRPNLPVSPLDTPTAVAAAQVDRGLALESHIVGRYVLPVSASGPKGTTGTDISLQSQLERKGSGLTVLPGMQMTSGGRVQMEQSRVGFTPSEFQIEAGRDLWQRAASSVGVSQELISAAGRSATFRQFLAQSVSPRLLMIAQEVGRVLEDGTGLRPGADAADGLSLRARAVKSLVEAGHSLADAKEIAGL